MNMPEELQRTTSGMVPCYHRVAAQRVGAAFPGAIPDLDQMRQTIPWQCLGMRIVVIPDEQIFAYARQSVEDLPWPDRVFRPPAECKVADDPKVVAPTHTAVQVLNKRRVHLVDVAKRPVA